jgi:TonB family protein
MYKNILASGTAGRYPFLAMQDFGSDAGNITTTIKHFVEHNRIAISRSIHYLTAMKPTLLIASLIICHLSTFAQTQDTTYFNAYWRDTTAMHASFYRVRIKQGAGWQVADHFINGKTQMTGTYSDDSCKIKQGEFTWFDSTGLASHRCTYKDNKENGKEIYLWPNKKSMTTGNYKNGERDGEWIGYFRSGQVAGDVVYENGKQVSGTFYNDDGSKNKKIKEFIRESEYPGGTAQWLRFLNKTLKYPENAWKKKIEGIVVVQFIVDEEGNPTDVTVIKSVNPELDAEAVRVISQSKDWTPAIYGGRLVKSYKKQPIVFKLTDS